MTKLYLVIFSLSHLICPFENIVLECSVSRFVNLRIFYIQIRSEINLLLSNYRSFCKFFLLGIQFCIGRELNF